MKRPRLDQNISGFDFLDYYWLKSELQCFCRDVGLATSGSKIEIGERISHYLNTGEKMRVTPRPTKLKVPSTLSLDTVIEKGWSCSQALRRFFEQEIGPHFHFNAFMRNVIKHEAGKTLRQAIEEWQHDQQLEQPRSIDPQFEYNCFIRLFYKDNPQATREQVIQAWKIHRDTPKSKRGYRADIID